MEKPIRILWLLVLLSLLGVGEVYGNPDHEMDIEIIRYFPSDKAMLVEAFIEIPMQSVTYEKTSNEKYKYDLHFMVDLLDTDKNKLFHDEWADSAEVEWQLISSERAYRIEPVLSVPLDIGGYELLVTVKDRKSGNIQEFRREIVDPGESRILSDIVLANSIVVDTTSVTDKRDIFRKGNLRINVNSRGIYYGKSPIIFFYYQIRNSTEEFQNMQIQMDILNAEGEVVKSLDPRNLALSTGVQADAFGFSCSGLQAGGYFLRLMTYSPHDKKLETPITVTKSFTVDVRKERTAQVKEKSVERNEYVGFSEEQLDSVFSMMRYLVSREQKKEYKELNVQGKRSFLHNAWKAIDPIPATDENEFREIHSKRINYAMKEFETVWKSKKGEEHRWAVDDRGMIYIKYGEPDERIIRPNEYGSDPYEIWKYYSSGYSYLYLERIRTQGYELIFTNNRDETYLPSWERYFPRLVVQDIYRELGAAINR
jgi:GWxTD domain-containing protein